MINSYSRITKGAQKPLEIKDNKDMEIYSLSGTQPFGNLISKSAYTSLQNAFNKSERINFQTYPSLKWRSILMYRMGNPKPNKEILNEIKNTLQVWNEISERDVANWLITFNKLGFYQLIGELQKTTITLNQEINSLLSISYNKNNGYDLESIIDYIKSPKIAASEKLENIISLVVISTKGKKNSMINEVEELVDNYLKQVSGKIDDPYLLSWLYRAVAMVPAVKGNLNKMTYFMDLAEHYGEKISKNHILYSENIFPLMQSRSKEKLIIKDYEKAISYQKKLIDLSPNDSYPPLQLSIIYKEISDTENQIKALKDSSSKSPLWDVQALLNLCDIYRKSNMQKELNECLFQVIKYDPCTIIAIKNLVEQKPMLTHKQKSYLDYVIVNINSAKPQKSMDDIEYDLITSLNKSVATK